MTAIKFMQARAIVGNSTWFLSQDYLNSFITKENTPFAAAITGGLSSLFISFLTQPMDVGKITHQIGNFQSIYSLYKQHGIKRFYTPNIFAYSLSRTVISGAIFNFINSKFN